MKKERNLSRNPSKYFNRRLPMLIGIPLAMGYYLYIKPFFVVYGHNGFAILSSFDTPYICLHLIITALLCVFPIFAVHLLINTRKPILHSLPHIWDLLQYALFRKARHEMFVPYYEEMKDDLIVASKFKGKWELRWLTLCFVLKTVYVIGRCLYLMAQGKLLKILLSFVPAPIREFFKRLGF